jgi:hypothetical protein
MGEVYRARDTKLNRDVASRCCPMSSRRIAIASPASSGRRSSRVAQPSEHREHLRMHESDGVKAIVMELVEGETLDVGRTRHPIGHRWNATL